jgi:hypothetical protein
LNPLIIILLVARNKAPSSHQLTYIEPPSPSSLIHRPHLPSSAGQFTVDKSSTIVISRASRDAFVSADPKAVSTDDDADEKLTV